jgi:transposase
LAVKNHATSFVLEDLNITGDTRCVLGFIGKRARPGKHVIKIHGFSPSSKLCHQCDLPLSIREWDVSAAKNICAMGKADTLGLIDCVLPVL